MKKQQPTQNLHSGKAVMMSMEDTDILVNCTSIGLDPDTNVPDINYYTLKSSTVVCESHSKSTAHTVYGQSTGLRM